MKRTFLPTWESIRTHEIPAWYQDCKLGIFIHWGLYSVPAFATPTAELGTVSDEEWYSHNPYAEWYYNSLNIGRGATYEHHQKTYGRQFQYEDFADLWKAENFKPEEWAALFKEAGAGYVVMVTKHHDGFCLFPSQYTDYNAVRRGPKQDLVGALTAAVRARGMKMGLYYSGILDWRFAHEPIGTDAQLKYNGSPTYEYADYAYKQALELIDRYHPAVFWNDIGWPYAGEQQLPYLFSHYYNTCEDGVVDDRFNGLWHDFSTKEYQHGQATRAEKWEMCRGLGLSFGYNAMEGAEHILSVPQLVSLLVSTVANNGNLLINVGPQADGTIPAIQAERLRGLGQWIAVNGEAIYGTRCSRRTSVQTPAGDIHFTSRNKDLYIILDGLKAGDTTILVPDTVGQPNALAAATRFSFQPKAAGLEITIVDHQPDDGAVVFKVVKGE